ncbi:MAG: Txe/YoeB family addiction module toxin [Pedobacter sp.]|nr:MAG: Txe/YoeB family addiction module toxin [Pedobacter sp.]
MEVIYSPEALDDLKYWKKSGNKATLKKIQTLISAIQASPFEGIGKPEQLKHNLSGRWSRRIDREHRIVYRVDLDENTEVIIIVSLKGHY